MPGPAPRCPDSKRKVIPLHVIILLLVSMEIYAGNSSALQLSDQSVHAFGDAPSGYWPNKTTLQIETSNDVKLPNTSLINSTNESTDLIKNSQSLSWLYGSSSSSPPSPSSTSSSSASSSSSSLDVSSSLPLSSSPLVRDFVACSSKSKNTSSTLSPSSPSLLLPTSSSASPSTSASSFSLSSSSSSPSSSSGPSPSLSFPHSSSTPPPTMSNSSSLFFQTSATTSPSSLSTTSSSLSSSSPLKTSHHTTTMIDSTSQHPQHHIMTSPFISPSLTPPALTSLSSSPPSSPPPSPPPSPSSSSSSPLSSPPSSSSPPPSSPPPSSSPPSSSSPPPSSPPPSSSPPSSSPPSSPPPSSPLHPLPSASIRRDANFARARIDPGTTSIQDFIASTLNPSDLRVRKPDKSNEPRQPVKLKIAPRKKTGKYKNLPENNPNTASTITNTSNNTINTNSNDTSGSGDISRQRDKNSRDHVPRGNLVATGSELLRTIKGQGSLRVKRIQRSRTLRGQPRNSNARAHGNQKQNPNLKNNHNHEQPQQQPGDETNTILDFNSGVGSNSLGGRKGGRDGGRKRKKTMRGRNVAKKLKDHPHLDRGSNVLWRGRNFSRGSFHQQKQQQQHHYQVLMLPQPLQHQQQQQQQMQLVKLQQHAQQQQQFVPSSDAAPVHSNDLQNNEDYHKNSISSRFKGHKHLPDCPVLPPCHCPGKLSMKVKVVCDVGGHFPSVVGMNPLVKSVSISYADLSHLPDYALEPLKIDELDLQGNNFGHRIGSRALSGVGRQLISLNLAWCNITRLPGKLFKGMTSLRNLTLAENHVKRIFPLTFRDLVNLERLSLSGNPLYELNAELLRYQSSLRHLDVGYCRLEKLAWNSFSGLWRLETLDLRGNQLRALDPYAFSDLRSLQVLYLGHNLLRRLESKSLSGLKSLRLLNLAESRLKEIERDAFVDLKQLEELNLSDNKLRHLHVGTLLLPRLQILLLDGNQLAGLPNEITYLPALRHLDLSYNRIKTIDKCLLFDHLQLETLNLRENPFHCDCSMFWLRETKVRLLKRWTERKRGLPFIPGNCWTPLHFRGIPVTEWLSMECVVKNAMEEENDSSSCHNI